MNYCYRCGKTTHELVHTATTLLCGRCAQGEQALTRNWLSRVELFDNLVFAAHV